MSALTVTRTADPCLATTKCSACPNVGVTMVLMGKDDTGPFELAYCHRDCARPFGWPGLIKIRRAA